MLAGSMQEPARSRSPFATGTAAITARAPQVGAIMGGLVDQRIVEQRPLATLSAEETLPDSDGRPIAESDDHYRAIISVRGPLEVRFRNRGDIYISGDLLLYYDPADGGKSVAPDFLVVRGVSPRRRRSYVLWEEGKPPDCVVEVSSPDSGRTDRVRKRELYARLGVAEYFLFDPVYGDPRHEGRLQCFRLYGGRSVPVGPRGAAGSVSELASEVLGVSMRPEAKRLRLRDLGSGKDLLHFDETEEDRQAERVARKTAEARVVELEAELRRMRRDPRDSGK